MGGREREDSKKVCGMGNGVNSVSITDMRKNDRGPRLGGGHSVGRKVHVLISESHMFACSTY